MKNLLLSVILALAVSGCGILERHESSAKLVTQYAVMKYAEQIPEAERAERLGRVRTTAEEVKGVANGEVTLALLREFVNQKAADANLSPADRLLVNALIQIVADELELKIGQGVLSPEQRVQVAEVMDWVIEATNLAAPSQFSGVER